MKGLVAVVLGFVLASCGSSSGGDPQALCKEGAQATCSKLFSCAEGAALRALLGLETESMCVTQLSAECSAMPCDTGETYHADKAQSCLNAVKALQCSELTTTPAVCDEVCTGGTAASK